ncbi:esterase-like activity of phytase family protein [Sulfurimonas microaerophilic]|uniref:esterase-like activity of phytase family protein n=1 Tax=Sulfurimonas microaerophilic TaxID=3058392 RepID=UPI00271493F8|nr:esterase-like activity of phytase family protein [Sulfurimonas sp. hsl 1-7]
MKLLIIPFLLLSNLFAYTICPNGEQECQIGKIHILDTKKLSSFDDKLSEFSALVLKENTLYCLSDKGRLLHFDFAIKDKKIETFKYKNSYSLKDKQGKKLSKNFRDAEGMDIYGKGVAISFEGKNRVELYDLYGNCYKSIKLNKKLRKNENYESINKGLESVAYSSLYGIITAPEAPLKKKKKHRIYSRDFTWKFDAEGFITDIKFIDTHNVIVLMRDTNIFTRARTTQILKIDLSSCIDGTCSTESLAKISSQDGWKIDNFEGIEKVDKNTYLMVSDDNDSLFQNTLLVLFEIVKG